MKNYGQPQISHIFITHRTHHFTYDEIGRHSVEYLSSFVKWYPFCLVSRWFPIQTWLDTRRFSRHASTLKLATNVSFRVVTKSDTLHIT